MAYTREDIRAAILHAMLDVAADSEPAADGSLKPETKRMLAALSGLAQNANTPDSLEESATATGGSDLSQTSGQLDPIEERLQEAGFTGVVKDKLGRELHYVNGRRVKKAASGPGEHVSATPPAKRTGTVKAPKKAGAAEQKAFAAASKNLEKAGKALQKAREGLSKANAGHEAAKGKVAAAEAKLGKVTARGKKGAEAALAKARQGEAIAASKREAAEKLHKEATDYHGQAAELHGKAKDALGAAAQPAPAPEKKPAPAKGMPTAADVRQGFDSLPGAKDNLVKVADLGKAHGLNPEQTKALVQDLRAKGVLGGMAYEGRNGATPEEAAYHIDDGDGRKIGYVSLRPDQEPEAPAPTPPPAPEPPKKPTPKSAAKAPAAAKKEKPDKAVVVAQKALERDTKSLAKANAAAGKAAGVKSAAEKEVAAATESGKGLDKAKAKLAKAAKDLEAAQAKVESAKRQHGWSVTNLAARQKDAAAKQVSAASAPAAGWKAPPNWNPGDNNPAAADRVRAEVAADQARNPVGDPKRINKKFPKESRPDLTTAEREAAGMYAASYYRQINSLLRHNAVEGSPPHLRKMLDDLASAFKKAKPFAKPVDVKRSLSNPGPAFIDSLKAAAASGSEVVIPGYSSTTNSKELSGDWDNAGKGSVTLNIKAVKGLDLKPHSGDHEEDELLLDHNSKFRVLSVTQNKNGGHVVEMEQVL